MGTARYDTKIFSCLQILFICSFVTVRANSDFAPIYSIRRLYVRIFRDSVLCEEQTNCRYNVHASIHSCHSLWRNYTTRNFAIYSGRTAQLRTTRFGVFWWGIHKDQMGKTGKLKWDSFGETSTEMMRRK